MSIVWTGIFVVLCVEAVIVLFLLLPFPKIVQSTVNFVSKSAIVSQLKPIRVFFYMLCTLMFAESMRQQATTIDHRVDPSTEAYRLGLIERFRAQRNVYISFFSLFFVFVIDRIGLLVLALGKAEREAETITKQAKQNVIGIKNYLNQEKAKEASKPAAAEDDKKDSKFVDLVQENRKLKASLEELEADLRASRLEAQRLSDRVETLNKVVEDYHISGDKLKKEK
eukprot:c10571_g1_i2.p1 GENE.c10571_g1_i2~~c10571_g1_i2.p1  ORF type:complete len:225 (+),score=68.91 c10571_g1_i2:254-928(+)